MAQGVMLAHFGRLPGEELIVLKLKEGTRAAPAPVLLDYPETALTARYKAELRTINLALAGADIAFLDDPSGPAVDDRDRIMRRRFLAVSRQDFAFDKGGRLYGGFWQNLKAERRGRIRIDGEPVADLDFKSMFARLAYVEAVAEPPDGDLYAIDGLEEYRSGVKLLINALFWDDKRTRRDLPEGIGVGVGTDEDARQDPGGEAVRYEARFPAGWTYQRLLSAIHDKHPELKVVLGRGIGGRLMHQESEIVVRVLLGLIDQGITSLPLHDGLMVAQSAKGTAMEAMRRGARDVTGADLPVVEKT